MAKAPVNPSVDDLTRAVRDLRREVDRISGGGLTIRRDLDMRNHRIINLSNPVEKKDAVTPAAVGSEGGTIDTGSGGGGVTEHGDLTGLGDNDHPQYLLASASGPSAFFLGR